MSEMEMRVLVTIESLVDAIVEAGGEVRWPAETPSRSAKLGVEALVDQEDAAAAMGRGWFECDECAVQPDADDLADFARACATGDRLLAQALLPRIAQDRAVARLEPLLQRMGGRA